MFSEGDRVLIRQYLGASRMYITSDPRLESSITNAQSVEDGGSAPDGSTESMILSIIDVLQATDAAIINLDSQQGALGVQKIQIDSTREMARLRSKGRMFVGRLSAQLNYRPIFDVFGLPPPPSPTGIMHRT